MPFQFGQRSLRELEGVHEDLIDVTRHALMISAVDFAVHDGFRTEAEQEELVARGVSQTRNSRHLTGHAVDLVPYAGGKLRWDWEPIFEVCSSMRRAALHFEVPLRWGGSWGIITDDESFSKAPRTLFQEYVSRRVSRGMRAFPDGAHFELPRSRYL